MHVCVNASCKHWGKGTHWHVGDQIDRKMILGYPPSFDAFVAAINELARKDDALDSTGKYCAADAWQDSFDDGMTPEEAWAEEKSNWGY